MWTFRIHTANTDMFAVPDWNVSARSLAQEQPSGSGLLLDSKTATQTSDSQRRKRARNDAETSRKIGGYELEKLWNQRFGEKVTKEPQKKDRLKSKLKPTEDGIREATSLEKKPESLARDDKDDVPGTVRREHQKKDKKQTHKQKDHQQPSTPAETNATPSRLLPPQPPPPPTAPSNLTPLQLKMRNKLTSARFRHLNQTLYTSPSSTALSLFSTSPDLFSDYHAGFTQQVQSSWPTNPVDTFISSIRTRGHLAQPSLSSAPPLPRRKTLSCTVADLGCGDAPLARTLIPSSKKLHLTIHSYDLFSPNKHVTVADIAHLPLRDGEADIAIFCLSLMGTNWIDFIEEAWRILRGDGKGELWVAEVKSRFGRRRDAVVEHSVGKQRKKQGGNVKKKKQEENEGEEEIVGEELFASSVRDRDESDGDTTDIKPFASVLLRRGFTLQDSSVDKSNKMFVSMIFHKSGVPTAGKYQGWKWNGKEYAKQHDGKMRFVGGDEEDVSRGEEGRVLKPCVYKSR